MAAPTEVPEGFEKLPDGRWAVEEEMVLDIGNTINDLQTRIEILEKEKRMMQQALESEREQVAKIEKQIAELKKAKDELERKKDERIDNLLEIVKEQNQTIVKLNEERVLENMKWAGGGTLAGAFVALAVILSLSN